MSLAIRYAIVLLGLSLFSVTSTWADVEPVKAPPPDTSAASKPRGAAHKAADRQQAAGLRSSLSSLPILAPGPRIVAVGDMDCLANRIVAEDELLIRGRQFNITLATPWSASHSAAVFLNGERIDAITSPTSPDRNLQLLAYAPVPPGRYNMMALVTPAGASDAAIPTNTVRVAFQPLNISDEVFAGKPDQSTATPAENDTPFGKLALTLGATDAAADVPAKKPSTPTTDATKPDATKAEATKAEATKAEAPTTGVVPASKLLFSEDFEKFSTPTSSWAFAPVDGGTIQPVTTGGPQSGKYHLMFAGPTKPTIDCQSATLDFSLAGHENDTDLFLTFAAKPTSNGTFTIELGNALDGPWAKVDLTPSTPPTDKYSMYMIDLDKALADTKIDRTKPVFIRFQDCGNGTTTHDLYLDDVKILKQAPKVLHHIPTVVPDEKDVLMVVRFTFNMAIDPASFTADDVILTDPQGTAVPRKDIVVTARPGNTEFDVGFPVQTIRGTYRLTIGPDITDGSNKMDQNDNGKNGEASVDAYTAKVVYAPTPATLSGTTSPPSTDEATPSPGANSEKLKILFGAFPPASTPASGTFKEFIDKSNSAATPTTPSAATQVGALPTSINFASLLGQISTPFSLDGIPLPNDIAFRELPRVTRLRTPLPGQRMTFQIDPQHAGRDAEGGCNYRFGSTAQFPLPQFTSCGREACSRTALIYEGMQLTVYNTGYYRVRFVIETPDMPLVLRLQLRLQHCPTSDQFTLTLPTVSIPGRDGFTDKTENVWLVETNGYLHSLKENAPFIKLLNRDGVAQMGYGAVEAPLFPSSLPATIDPAA